MKTAWQEPHEGQDVKMAFDQSQTFSTTLCNSASECELSCDIAANNLLDFFLFSDTFYVKLWFITSLWTHLWSCNGQKFPTVPNNEAIFSFTVNTGIQFDEVVTNIQPCMKLFSIWCECASLIKCIVWMPFEIKSDSTVTHEPLDHFIVMTLNCKFLWETSIMHL